MVHFMNGLILYLILQLFKLLIVRSESITIVHIVPGDEGLLNCSESSSIIIRNVSVQNIGQCESRQTDCNLNRNDHELIQECDGSSSCHVNGSFLTSACLWDDLHFNMSYICNVPYEYVGCYVDDRERVLDEDHKNNNQMSADICYRICTVSQKWTEGDYFGTQYAKECSCGDGKQLGSKPYLERNKSECKLDCLGHIDEKCGGDYRMSVYRITNRNHNSSCLDMDQEHIINCVTNYLQEESLCMKFDASLENKNPRCSDIGNQLYKFCRSEHPYEKCDFNMRNTFKATNENQPSRSISIEYLCKVQDLKTIPSVESTTHESTTVGHIIPGNEVLLNCSESSSITIRNISIQNIGKCESNQNKCHLNRSDHELINGCEGSPSCHVGGSVWTTACLWEDLHFDLSYICKASYEYVGCYVDDNDRVLDEDHKRNPAMSADICFNICTENQTSYKHVYFGTQFEHECFCGDGQELSSQSYPRKKDSECNRPCLQHEDEKCGGSYKMSVYKIETQISNKHSCLKVDQKNVITDCNTYQLQEKSLCVKFDGSSTNKATEQRCRNQDYEIGNQLYKFCTDTKRIGNCVYNLASLLTTDIKLLPPTKNISIMYSCKEEVSTISSTLSISVTSSSTFSNYVNFSTSTSAYANVKKSRETSENNIGTVVGSVAGSILFLCIVFIGICIGIRLVSCDKSKEKLRTNPETNDYIGNQNIALPQAVSPTRHLQYEDLQITSGNRSTHNYASANIHLQNIDDKYDYAKNIETNESKTFDDETSIPTYVVLQNDSYKPNPESNDNEYAVVDPTAEPSFKQTPKTSTQGTENYMILDPSQTGINRSKFPNADQSYELAKPINDIRGHKTDLYTLSPEGTYDHSGITRHHKDQDTIYTHAVDNVYDSASRGLNIARKEDTYDHFFGQETEDEYDISMH